MDRATWDQLKILRERTWVGLSECRRALEDARGDIEDAIEILRRGRRGVDVERFLFPAQVHVAVSSGARTAVLVELAAPHRPRDHAEVLDPFFAEVLAVAARTPPGADLAAQPLGGSTVGAAAEALSGRIGLPIAVRRWARVDVAPGADGCCAARAHPWREMGAIVLVTASSAAVAAHPAARRFADELAAHVDRRWPGVIARADLDPALVAQERAQIEEEAVELARYGLTAGEMVGVKQRLFDSWAARRVLLEQKWGWERDGRTTGAALRAASAEAGGELSIERFAWFERGDRECVA